jgi:hypothetical protein
VLAPSATRTAISRCRAADDAQVALTARPLRDPRVEELVGLHRVRDAGALREEQPEVFGQHSDHEHRPLVDVDRPADDAAVAAEAALPEAVAEQNRPGRPLDVVLGLEDAARQRLDAESGEEVGRHEPDPHELRLAIVGDRDAVGPDRAEALEVRRARAQVPELRPGQRRARIAGGRHVGPDQQQAVRVEVGRRREQGGVQHAEDRGRRAEPEREGHHRQGREPRRPDEPAPRLAHVFPRLVPGAHQPRLAHRRLDVRHAAHLAAGEPSRFVEGEALGLAARDQVVEVARELLVELGVHARAPEESLPEAREPRQEPHV